MKPYGQKTKDHGCCPGHDKFPGDRYNGRPSRRARARDKGIMHRIARARSRVELGRELRDLRGAT